MIDRNHYIPFRRERKCYKVRILLLQNSPCRGWGIYIRFQYPQKIAFASASARYHNEAAIHKSLLTWCASCIPFLIPFIIFTMLFLWELLNQFTLPLGQIPTRNNKFLVIIYFNILCSIKLGKSSWDFNYWRTRC